MLTIISDMKNRGVLIDFLISLRGVLIIKQEQTLGSLSMDLSSYCKAGIVI
jgi:hypothetical protein